MAGTLLLTRPPLHEPTDGPPPLYSAPQPATLAPTPLGATAPHPPTLPPAVPVPVDEAPPDYFQLPPKAGAVPSGKAGLAVQIQMDGRLVPGTVMEDVSSSL